MAGASWRELEASAPELAAAMAGSLKLADARRDPRVEIHSAPLDTELSGGDAKLAGRLVEVGPTAGPDGASFELAIEVASLVRVEGDELVLAVWRPESGSREIRRK